MSRTLNVWVDSKGPSFEILGQSYLYDTRRFVPGTSCDSLFGASTIGVVRGVSLPASSAPDLVSVVPVSSSTGVRIGKSEVRKEPEVPSDGCNPVRSGPEDQGSTRPSVRPSVPTHVGSVQNRLPRGLDPVRRVPVSIPLLSGTYLSPGPVGPSGSVLSMVPPPPTW